MGDCTNGSRYFYYNRYFNLDALMMDTVYDRLIDLERKHNMNDRQLAKLIGVPITTLRGWLYGIRVPGSSTFRTLELLELIEQHAPRFYRDLIDAAMS